MSGFYRTPRPVGDHTPVTACLERLQSHCALKWVILVCIQQERRQWRARIRLQECTSAHRSVQLTQITVRAPFMPHPPRCPPNPSRFIHLVLRVVLPLVLIPLLPLDLFLLARRSDHARAARGLMVQTLTRSRAQVVVPQITPMLVRKECSRRRESSDA